MNKNIKILNNLKKKLKRNINTCDFCNIDIRDNAFYITNEDRHSGFLKHITVSCRSCYEKAEVRKAS